MSAQARGHWPEPRPRAQGSAGPPELLTQDQAAPPGQACRPDPARLAQRPATTR